MIKITKKSIRRKKKQNDTLHAMEVQAHCEKWGGYQWMGNIFRCHETKKYNPPNEILKFKRLIFLLSMEQMLQKQLSPGQGALWYHLCKQHGLYRPISSFITQRMQHEIKKNYRVAQKSNPLSNLKKIVLIALKPVNEIRFIPQIKVWIKHYYSLTLDILCVTYFLISITMTDLQTSNTHQIR